MYTEEIKKEIADNKVLLYAKGTKERPLCGFSAQSIALLNSYNIDFTVVDISSIPEKKEALKQFSDWPTIPQLYIKEQFIGGCDIMKELHQNGELKKLLQE